MLVLTPINSPFPLPLPITLTIPLPPPFLNFFFILSFHVFSISCLISFLLTSFCWPGISPRVGDSPPGHWDPPGSPCFRVLPGAPWLTPPGKRPGGSHPQARKPAGGALGCPPPLQRARALLPPPAACAAGGTWHLPSARSARRDERCPPPERQLTPPNRERSARQLTHPRRPEPHDPAPRRDIARLTALRWQPARSSTRRPPSRSASANPTRKPRSCPERQPQARGAAGSRKPTNQAGAGAAAHKPPGALVRGQSRVLTDRAASPRPLKMGAGGAAGRYRRMPATAAAPSPVSARGPPHLGA